MQSSDHPDLVQYRAQTYTRDFANPQRFLWSLKQMASLGDYRSKQILDVEIRSLESMQSGSLASMLTAIGMETQVRRPIQTVPA